MANNDEARELFKTFSLLGGQMSEGYQRSREKEESERRKARRQQLLLALFGPAVSKGITNIIQAPFHEPVQRFLNTEEGRLIKFRQKRALAEGDRLKKVRNATITAGGEGGQVYGIEEGMLENFYESMASPNMFGPDWKKNPLAVAFSESQLPGIREEAVRQSTELDDRITALSGTPTDKQLASLITQSKVMNPNATTAGWRYLVERLGGKTRAQRTDDGIDFIVTGNNPDGREGLWYTEASDLFRSESAKAGALIEPGFIRRVLEQARDPELHPELANHWALLDDQQKTLIEIESDNVERLIKLNGHPANNVPAVSTGTARRRVIRDLQNADPSGRYPTPQAVDDDTAKRSKSLDLTSPNVLSALRKSLLISDDMRDTLSILKRDLTIYTHENAGGRTANPDLLKGAQSKAVEDLINSTLDGWILTAGATYNAARLQAIENDTLDDRYVGPSAAAIIEETIKYGVERIAEDYIATENQDMRSRWWQTDLTASIVDWLPIDDMEYDHPISRGTMTRDYQLLFTEEMTDIVSGLSEDEARERAAKRIEMRETLNRRVDENLRRHSDDPQENPSLLNNMYRGPKGNRTTGAKTQITAEPRLPRLWNNARGAYEIPPEVQEEYSKIRSMYENGEFDEGDRAREELIQALERDNPGERFKLHDIVNPDVYRKRGVEADIMKTTLELGGTEMGQAPMTTVGGRIAETMKDRQVGQEIMSEVKFKDPKNDDERSFNDYIDLLYKEEGFKRHVYEDPIKKDRLTVGLGHLLTPEELERYKQGDQWTDEDLLTVTRKDTRDKWNAAKVQMQELGIDDNDFLVTLGSVNFQLGVDWWNEEAIGDRAHDKTWAALKAGDYEEAIRQISNSLWYNQTRDRAVAFQRAIRKLMDAQSPSLLRRPDPESRLISTFGI